MKTGIENIFLTYANLPPKKMPGNLKKVYEVARDYFEIHQSTHDEVLKLFDLVKYYDEGQDQKISKYDILKSNLDAIAICSVMIYSENICIHCRKLTLSHLDDFDIFNIKRPTKINTKRPKCYDCSQFQFIDFLTRKFVNKEHGTIDKIMLGIFNNGYKSIRKQIEYTGRIDQSGEKRKLVSYLQWEIRQNIESINDIILDLAAVSLCEFLLKNDSRKIKKCPYCNTFYIAKNTKRKTRCYSDNCNREYQRDKKRIQREKEPDIYRY